MILNDRIEGKEIACLPLCAHYLESLPGEKGSSLTGRGKAVNQYGRMSLKSQLMGMRAL